MYFYLSKQYKIFLFQRCSSRRLRVTARGQKIRCSFRIHLMCSIIFNNKHAAIKQCVSLFYLLMNINQTEPPPAITITVLMSASIYIGWLPEREMFRCSPKLIIGMNPPNVHDTQTINHVYDNVLTNPMMHRWWHKMLPLHMYIHKWCLKTGMRR